MEGNPGVHHRLALHHAGEILRRDIDVREHLQVGKPPGPGAGLFRLGLGQGRFLELPRNLPPLEAEAVFKAVPPDGDVHVPGGVLGGAGAQAVEAQRELVVVPGHVIIFAPGVELAEDQLPVEALLLLVPVHRAAPARVLHLHAPVQKTGDGDGRSVALPGLVDGVG